MMDMLVRLYDLPDIEEELRKLEKDGILIRRPGLMNAIWWLDG